MVSLTTYNPIDGTVAVLIWMCIHVRAFALTRVMSCSGERAGWTGDSAFASESECFDFDTGAFFSQFMKQIRQGQCADGTIGNVVPATDPRRDGGQDLFGVCRAT